MSVASVVTRGFGSFGSVNLVPTLGYSTASPATCGRTVASTSFVQGAQASGGFVQGPVIVASFVQGAQKTQPF